MGGAQTRPDINISFHQDKFKTVSQNCQAGPVQERSCKDMCCLVTFIIITLIFFGVGIYFIANIDGQDFKRIANASNGLNPNPNSNSKTPVLTVKHQLTIQNQYIQHNQVSLASGAASQQFPNLLKTFPYVILMSILALILSLTVVILVSKIPKIMIYSMLVLTTVLIVAGIVVGFVSGILQLAIFCIVFGVIWIILLSVMLCCYRSQFQAAIVLLKVTGSFIRSKPTVLLAPLFVMLISYIYFAFWLASFLGIQLDRSFDQQTMTNMTTTTTTSSAFGTTAKTQQPEYKFDQHDLWSLLWIFFNFFYSYFLYYVLVFLIATATALWYYNIQANYLFKGLKYIFKSHIGSFTFASLMVAIVSSLRSAADNQNSNNACACVCICIIRCCLSFLQEIIKVLNHNAVIVMSVTGEDFIDSAKSAIYLIYNNFGLFVAVDMVEFLLKICVLFLVVLLPTGLGLLLLKLTYDQAANVQDLYLIFGAIIIFIICLLISLLIITVLSQALSCVFIFFCLDQKFRQFNFGIINRVPSDLRGLFNEIENEGRNVDANNLYRDSKQVL